VLIVNGEKIENSAIQAEIERMRPHYQSVFKEQSPEEQQAQLEKWARENLIERLVLRQKAGKDIRPIPREAVKKAYKALMDSRGGEEKYLQEENLTSKDIPRIRADVELELRIERLLQEACRGLDPPGIEQARAYYREHKQDYITPEQVHAAHLVKHINAECDDETAHQIMVRAQQDLKAGKSFEQVAEQYSDCPENGGDLGQFPRGKMVQAFEDVVFDMPEGQVSDIFKTEFGYHIARVIDKTPAQAIYFDKVADDIRKKLYEEKRNQRIEEFLDKLMAEARVTESDSG